MPLTCQKHLFSLDPDVHYVNGAYMSPLMKSAEKAGIEAMKLKRSPNRITPIDFFTDANRLRGLFAKLVNAPKGDSVALVPSVSFGMAVVAKNLKVRLGQKIVVAEEQFPSNVYPWMSLAKEKRLKLETVQMPEDQEDRAENWNKAILEAIDENTVLVALGHIHWANGTLFDLEKIAQKTHAMGGLIVVDGTQSVGALPMDVQKFGLDALVCGGYKWLMGPYSMGYAWFGEAFLKGKPLEENWINRKNSEDFANLVNYQAEYQPGALRFDVGERSNFILVPMCIAVLEQLLAWNPAEIQAYCRDLTREAVQVWQQNGFWSEKPESRAHHLFGLELPEKLSPETLRQRLAERKVSVSVRGRFVRISPNVYNDLADIQAVTEVLLAV